MEDHNWCNREFFHHKHMTENGMCLGSIHEFNVRQARAEAMKRHPAGKGRNEPVIPGLDDFLWEVEHWANGNMIAREVPEFTEADYDYAETVFVLWTGHSVVFNAKFPIAHGAPQSTTVDEATGIGTVEVFNSENPSLPYIVQIPALAYWYHA